MAKRPATQFYWGDWRRDTALRACSLAARGLWIDLLCVMHDGEPYGHLAVKGVMLTDQEAAGVIGVPVARYRKLLAELEGKGVPSRTDDGMLFSRRMVRDEHIRTVRASSGKLGGNPNLLDKHTARSLVNQTRNQKPTPASASASASTSADADVLGGAGDLTDWIPAEYHPDLCKTLTESGRPSALLAELRLLKREPEARQLTGVTGEHVGMAIRDAGMKRAVLTGKTLAGFIRVAQTGVVGSIEQAADDYDRKREERERRYAAGTD